MHIRSFLRGPIVGKSKPLKTQSLLKLSVYQKKRLVYFHKRYLCCSFMEFRERLKKHDLQQKDVHPITWLEHTFGRIFTTQFRWLTLIRCKRPINHGRKLLTINNDF